MGKKKKGSKKGKGSKKKSTSSKGTKTKVLTGEEKLWAKRLQISEASRTQHRSNASTLVSQNTRLQDDLLSAERDAIEVIAHFNQQIAQKDQDNAELSKQLKNIKLFYQQETAEIRKLHDEKIAALETRCETAEKLLAKSRAELEGLTEWNNKRQEMRDELDQLKRDNEDAKARYEALLEDQDKKNKQEKIRMRKEAEAEIEKLASIAHATAVNGLDVTTRKTYTKNVQLAEELSLTKSENTRLQNVNEVALRKNIQLDAELSESKMLAKQSVVKMKLKEKAIDALQEKVKQLETTLGLCVREFEEERHIVANQIDEATDGTRADLEVAHRALALKAAENKRIRHLAKYIVEQRSEMEVFFHEALNSVRDQISRSRKLYERSVKDEFRRQMTEANRNGVLPPIKSASSVQADYEAAAQMPEDFEQVDIRDLTWEQKETVLRRLFAKMNTSKKSSSNPVKGVTKQKDTTPPLPSWTSAESPALTSVEPDSTRIADSSSQKTTSFFLTDHDGRELTAD